MTEIRKNPGGVMPMPTGNQNSTENPTKEAFTENEPKPLEEKTISETPFKRAKKKRRSGKNTYPS